MSDTQTTQPRQGSALATLKALSSKKLPPPGSAGGEQAADPAMAGAKRNKNTVTLGIDSSVSETAATCAQLKKALEDAVTEFATFQSQIRDYGRSKRERYNDLYKCGVTTVEVPYIGENGSVKVVQVICSAKFSVAQDTVLGSKKDFGEHYDRLFQEERTKVLKPNAEELFANLLSELGLSDEDRENAMKVLFQETVKVSVREGFEAEAKKVPDHVKAVLDQAITRAQPGLKFPALES